jgi:hypothetical protein
MIIILNSIITGMQPTVAVILIATGLLGFVQTMGGFLLTAKTSYDSWKSFAINHIVMLTIIVVGFYIAHW